MTSAGIYIAAVLTSLLAVAIFGTLIYKLPRPANGWLLVVAVLICLPLQPLAFYLVWSLWGQRNKRMIHLF